MVDRDDLFLAIVEGHLAEDFPPEDVVAELLEENPEAVVHFPWLAAELRLYADDGDQEEYAEINHAAREIAAALDAATGRDGSDP
jgi:hypothetical protein